MLFKIKNIWNTIRLSLSFLLFAFYLIIGYLLLFSDTWSNILNKGREIIGAALLLYGALRFYIAYRRYKNKHKRIRVQSFKKKKKLIIEREKVKQE